MKKAQHALIVLVLVSLLNPIVLHPKVIASSIFQENYSPPKKKQNDHFLLQNFYSSKIEKTINNWLSDSSPREISNQVPRDRIIGSITRVSVSSDGSQSNGFSYDPSISADGRYIAFYSSANNLVSNDTNEQLDIFLRDLQTNITTRISVSSDGSQSNGNSYNPSISADGRYVAFQSQANNLVNDDTNGGEDIFVHDVQTNKTTRVSVSSDGTQSNGYSYDPSISADGRYVAFMSYDGNLVNGDTNRDYDIFVHDCLTNKTALVSVASIGSYALGHSANPSISADGRYIAFQSHANNLVSDDTNVSTDIFVRDSQTNTTTRVSVSSDGSQSNGNSYNPEITADGRFVVFYSPANNLVSDDTNGQGDIFVHDVLTNNTTRVPVPDDTSHYTNNPSISVDGRYVAYSAYPNFGSNINSNVFLFDRQGGETTILSFASDGGQTNGDSFNPSISLDRNIAFESRATNLVFGDTNNLEDIFVYRQSIIHTYTISGIIKNSDGNTISDATIFSNTGRSTISNSVGLFSFFHLPIGTYTVTPQKTGYIFSPTSITITITESNVSNVNFTATHLPTPPANSKPPLIIVHGWMGANETGYSCTPEIKKLGQTSSTLGELPGWFADRYEVWVANLDSSKFSTPSLEENAKCLLNQIRYVADRNSQPITILAHSMGGLVSRAAIRLIYPEIRIKALYTLGTPHAGINQEIINTIYPYAGFAILCNSQVAVCNMRKSDMIQFNKSHPNIFLEDGYTFLGGTQNGSISNLGWLGKLIYPWEGPNDGLVGVHSAVGLDYQQNSYLPYDWTTLSPPLQYVTGEAHTPDFSPENNYYTAYPGLDRSRAYNCLNALMNGEIPSSAYCESLSDVNQVFSQDLTGDEENPALTNLTEAQTGHLDQDQSVSLPLQIDSADASLFYLTWSGETPTYTLTRPDAVQIDPGYASSNPEEVTYETLTDGTTLPPYAAYSFDTTQIGEWQLNITASAGEVDYRTFAALESVRSLSIETDKDTYAIGDTATINATLLSSNGSGLSSAQVSAEFTYADGQVENLILNDQGDGLYSANYPILDAPGYLNLSITATGSDSGTAFTRQQDLLLAIASSNLRLTGNYNDQTQKKEGDSFFRALDINMEIELATSGEYALSADLTASDQFVAHAANILDLFAGTQTITLTFQGADIRSSGLDGPYTVTNLSITPLDTGINVQSAETVFTTSTAYRNSDFGACFPLTLTHTGQGNDPIASPSTSSGCASGRYLPGESIQLRTTAPGTGCFISGWSGTNNDNSSSLTNTLTMPGNEHQVSVQYKQGYCRNFSLNLSPTNAGSVNVELVEGTPCNGGYYDDSVLNLTASANNGFVFHSWSGNVSGSDNPVQLVIDSNKSVTAHFTPCLSLTTSTQPVSGGIITIDTPPNCGSKYLPGTLISLSAQANEGILFYGWGGGLNGISNPASFAIQSDKNISANFLSIPDSSAGFVKYQPLNGGVGASTSPTLSWTSNPDTEHYEVCIDRTDNDTCNSEWLNTGLGLDTSKILSNMQQNTSYFWQVRAIQGEQSLLADDGAWFTFKTGDPIVFTTHFAMDLSNDSAVLLSNPNELSANLTLTYTMLGNDFFRRDIVIPANSELTLSLDSQQSISTIGALSIMIQSDQLITAERTRQSNSVQVTSSDAEIQSQSLGNQGSSGLTTWYVEEASTLDGLMVNIAVKNPNSGAIDVNAIFIFKGGSSLERIIQIPANGSITLKPHQYNQVGNNKVFTTWLQAEMPFTIESAISIPGNKHISFSKSTVTQIPDCYALNLSTNGNGAVLAAQPDHSPGCPISEYSVGESISLTAKPANGWHISSWNGTQDDSKKTTTKNLIMPAADQLLSVTYTDNNMSCYPLILEVTGLGGEIPIAFPSNSAGCPDGFYHPDETINLSALPAEDWQVIGWEGTNDDSNHAANNLLSMPPDEHTIKVDYSFILPWKDDFSSQKDWNNSNTDAFVRDLNNQWLVWKTNYTESLRYYIPIEISSNNASISFKMRITTHDEDGNIFIGLAEDLSGGKASLSENSFPTGFFLSLNHNITTGKNPVYPYAVYSDISPVSSYDPEYLTSFINLLNTEQWYTFNISLNGKDWTIEVLNEENEMEGHITGSLPALHGAYQYLILFNNPTGLGSATWSGTLDEISLNGSP